MYFLDLVFIDLFIKKIITHIIVGMDASLNKRISRHYIWSSELY